MSQEPIAPQFPTALILEGPKSPRPGSWLCAVCCFLHQARVANDEEQQEKCYQGYRMAQSQEKKYFTYRIPNTSGYPMYEAVTLGPSPQFPDWILPVCWQHLLAYKPEIYADQQVPPGAQSRLHIGKSYRPKGENDDLRSGNDSRNAADD
jgi:hypothetical protein